MLQLASRSRRRRRRRRRRNDTLIVIIFHFGVGVAVRTLFVHPYDVARRARAMGAFKSLPRVSRDRRWQVQPYTARALAHRFRSRLTGSDNDDDDDVRTNLISAQLACAGPLLGVDTQTEAAASERDKERERV